MPTLAPAWLLLPSLLAAPDVLTVNVGGMSDFVDVQEAVDHAQAGDTILVWGPANSHYVFPAVTITKGIAIVGLTTDHVHLDDLVVRDVPAGESVVLVRLSVGESPPFPPDEPFHHDDRGDGAHVEDCAGPVFFQECLFQGGWREPGGPGLRAIRSDVAILGCELLGGSGGDAGASRTGHGNMQHGLVLEDARAFVSGSNLRGGSAGYIPSFEPIVGGRGGDGVRATGASTLWLLDSSVQGGKGYDVESLYPDRSYGGDGGAGVRLSGGSRGYARASLIEGGPGGSGETTYGEHGAAVLGPLVTQPGWLLTVGLPSWTRDSDPVDATIRGEPGVAASLLVGEAPGFHPKGRSGVLAADRLDRDRLGPIPVRGELQASIPLPAVGPGDARILVIQSVLEEPLGLALGEARVLVVLDEAFLPDRTLRVYVDPTAPSGGDGRSWSTAFRDLRRALERAPGLTPTTTDVWLREGTYKPLTRALAPIEPFFVKSHTRVFGGFAGTETDLSQRDALSHPTVLSGDLLGDDTAGDAHRFDNSRLVVAIGPWERRDRVRLDGLVVRAGYAQGYSSLIAPPFRGSGLELCGSVDIVGCTFVDNRFGPALSTLSGSELRAVGCRFLGNDGTQMMADGDGTVRAGWWDGAGSALFANCEFVGNRTKRGGGLYLHCATRIVNCTFFGNDASFQGGAIHTDWRCPSLIVENTLLWQNTSPTDPDFSIDTFRTSARVDFCLFQGGPSSPLGTMNIDGPPRLADPPGPDSILGTLDDDLTPLLRSPAVEAGNNAFLPADELDLDHDGDTHERFPLDAVQRARLVDDPHVPDTGRGTPPIVDIGSREKP